MTDWLIPWPATLPPPLSDQSSQCANGQADINDYQNSTRTRWLPEYTEHVEFIFNAAQMSDFRTFASSTLAYGKFFQPDWLEKIGRRNSCARLIQPYKVSLLGIGSDGLIQRVSVELEIFAIEASYVRPWDGISRLRALSLPDVNFVSTSVIAPSPVLEGPAMLNGFYMIDIVASAVAQWVLTYDDNGANSGEPHPVEYPECGSTVTVKNEGTLLKTGYVFDGWNTAVDGSGIDYAEGSTFVINSSVTLFAQWVAA